MPQSDPVKDAEKTSRELDEAIKNAKNDPPSQKQQAEAIEKFTKKLNDTPKSALQKEILALVDSTLAVNTAFLNVERALSNLVDFSDVKEITPVVKKEIKDLLSDWQKYRRRYSSLLWTAREVAGSAAAAADDFANIFVKTYFGEDSENIPITQIKTAIASAIERIDTDKLASAGLSQDFMDLKNDVNGFQERWGLVVKKFSLKYGSEKIKELRHRVENVEASLSSMKTKVYILSTAVGVLGSAALGLSVYGFFAPVALLGALAAALGSLAAGAVLAKALTDQNALLRELGELQTELGQAMGTKEIMEKLEAALATSEDDFQLIFQQLGSLGTVWAGIRTELQRIEEKLDIAMGPGDKLLFNVRMKNNIAWYNTIAETLTIYQNAVTDDKLPPRTAVPTSDVWAEPRQMMHAAAARR